MVDRRTVLQVGAAGLLPLTLGVAGREFVSMFEPPSRASIAIVDRRLAASSAFAEEARQRGASVHWIDGDIAKACINVFHNRSEPVPDRVVGLTTEQSLFYFDMLARDRGLRLVYRTDHQLVADGSVDHASEGPRGLLQLAAPMARRADWSRLAALVATSYPAGVRKPLRLRLGPSLERQRNAPVVLVSWTMTAAPPNERYSL